MKPVARNIILEEPSSFQFFTNDSGSHFLDVLCGGFAMFSVCIRLNVEELSYYRELGDYYIQKLARDISYSPNSFASRNVPQT